MSMLHPVHQGSESWHLLRCGRPTASEFDNLVSPQGKIREGQMPLTYLYEKLAETITGKPLEQTGTWQMDQGSILEGEAIPYFELMQNVKVQRMGFITDDKMRYGCSPDGLIGEESGIECKCPQSQTQVKYLLEGVLPPQYVAQVQGSMYVTGRPSWWFMSYSRKLPPLMLKVERDAKFQEALGAALGKWLADFDAALAKIDALKQ